MTDKHKHIGVTGTRHGATPEQHRTFARLLLTRYDYATVLHTGCCVGFDYTAHWIARYFGLGITAHPPESSKHLADIGAEVWYPKKGYYERDRDIVDNVHALIAAPRSMEYRGGGTWYTVRYALETGVRVDLIEPDGTLHLDWQDAP